MVAAPSWRGAVALYLVPKALVLPKDVLRNTRSHIQQNKHFRWTDKMTTCWILLLRLSRLPESVVCGLRNFCSKPVQTSSQQQSSKSAAPRWVQSWALILPLTSHEYFLLTHRCLLFLHDDPLTEQEQQTHYCNPSVEFWFGRGRTVS